MTKNSNIWIAVVGLALVAVFGFAVPGWKNHVPTVGATLPNDTTETSTPGIVGADTPTSTNPSAPAAPAPKAAASAGQTTGTARVISPVQNTSVRTNSGDTSNLLTVTYQGGTCPGNEICSTLKTVLRNGTYLVNGLKSYRLSPTAAENLLAQIDAANFPAIKSAKFTGECPTKTNGQELIYVFYASNGHIETISSCQTAIDYSSPLFAAVRNLLPPF